MSKQIFELFGLKKEPKHPIVARMQLYKAYDAKFEDAFGLWVIPLNEDGTNDNNAPRLYLPMGQLKEVLSGKFQDGFVQQYPSFNSQKKEAETSKPLIKKK